MDPTQSCEYILASLKKSNLNFHLSESPFSLSIQIKKSFIKDQNGVPRSSGIESDKNQLSEKNKALKDEIETLETKMSRFDIVDSTLTDLQSENASLLDQLDILQKEHANLKVEKEQIQIEQQIHEKGKSKLVECLEDKKSEIVLLKKSLKSLDSENSSQRMDLNQLSKNLKSKEKEIFRLESKLDNVSSNCKVFKAEMSKLKKEKINLEKDLKKESKKFKVVSEQSAKSCSTLVTNNSSDSVSSNSNTSAKSSSSTVITNNNSLINLSNNNISQPSIINPATTPMIDYPTFSTTEPLDNTISSRTSFTPESQSARVCSSTSSNSSTVSPSSENFSQDRIKESHTDTRSILCHHSPQCSERQPRPPPPEKCRILEHAGSMYHEHMASEAGVPSRYHTHEYCMRIEYNNYGCDKCVWFKWWGELHGYPDINPWTFREHLQPKTFL